MKENDLQLIETMLYRDTLRHLGLHLARLEKSAKHFNFVFHKPGISDDILKVTNALLPDKPYKVRLLLSREGKTEITTEIIDNFPDSFRIAISGKRTESNNEFLSHKTTNRDFYNNELARVREKGFFDIIFLNERDEITEGAITNIYIKKEGNLITPPESSGLLPGTIRTHLIKKKGVAEEIIFMDDLLNSDEIFISNAIIGLQPVAYSNNLNVL